MERRERILAVCFFFVHRHKGRRCTAVRHMPLNVFIHEQHSEIGIYRRKKETAYWQASRDSCRFQQHCSSSTRRASLGLDERVRRISLNGFPTANATTYAGDDHRH